MILVALLCLFLAPVVAARAGAEENPRPWRVVLIRGWDAFYRVNILREGAMREAMGANASRPVEIYPEDIDSLRFPGPELPELTALLRRKYGDKSVDLVIASGREPLEFATRHRDTLWPGAPILFNGVYDGQLDGWKRPARTTGVTARLDVAGTLQLARRLLPNAKKAYLIAGTADFDRYYLEFARREAARVMPGFEIEEVVGLTQAQLLERVSRFEPDAFALHLTVLRDGRGESGGPGAVNIALVAARSAVPVFAAGHSQWGRGTVGGSSSRTELHGQAAGEVARMLLDGADADAIPVRSTPEPTCELDAKAMERWGVPLSNAPPGCSIVNRPASWRDYSWSFLGLAAIILLQGALIWMLWRQSRERRRMEAQLRERGAELAQVARLSMIGALTASIAHEINQPMGAILSNAEAADMMLERGELKPDKLHEILLDIRNEDLRASEVISGLRKLLAQHESKSSPLDVNTEVAEALRHVAFAAAQKHVTLVPEFDRDIPPALADPVQLQQVVINLAMNAIEAVSREPERSREVRVSTQARPDGVQVVVADRGPGVAREDEDRLFHSMFTTKKDGMGLGLSIVRAIVESFGGRVWYERNVPHGAVFRVWLPAMGR